MKRVRQENRRRRDRRQRRKERLEVLGLWAKRGAIAIGLVVVGLGLPLAILQGYNYTMSSDYFALTYVDVEGLHYLEEDALLEAAEQIAGEHILNVRPERLEAVITTLPFVADVKVERRLPDRLHIAILEYEPMAIVVDEGFWLVDVHGEVFLALDAAEPGHNLWSLPLVTGLSRAELNTTRGREHLHVALRVHRLYEEMGLSEKQPISEVHVDPLLGVSLIVGETGTEVRLGWGRWEERLERLAVVQASLIRRGVDAAYVLIDQDNDLSRVAVGQRTGPGIGEVEESRF